MDMDVRLLNIVSKIYSKIFFLHKLALAIGVFLTVMGNNMKKKKN